MEIIQQAAQWVEEGKVEEAVAFLQEEAKTATDDTLFAIIDAFYEWGFFEEAIVLLETLLKKYPDEGELMILLADMFIELERDDEAIEQLNQLDASDSHYVQALLQLADVYHAQGLFEVAEQKLLEAKELEANEPVIDFALGEFLFAIGQSNRAIPFYEKVLEKLSDINGIEVQERLAESHAALGHYETALEYFKSLESDHPDVLFKYGFTAAQQNRNDIAIQAWRELLELDPYYHTVYAELAIALKEEGQIEEALETAKKGLEQDEFHKELYMIAGELSIQLQQHEAAIEYLQEALVLDYDYQKAVILLVDLYKSEGKQEAIIELLTSTQEMGADDPLYDWELARAYEEDEQYKEALAAYDKAYPLLGHDSAFLKEYGYFLTEEGQLAKAKTVLDSYLEFEPLDEDVRAFSERLNDSNQA